jgi:Fic family protein
MRSAGHVVNESNPFNAPVSLLPGGRPESPAVHRLRLMWADMREAVMAVFPAPRPAERGVSAVLDDIEARYVTDAYHSLSIEGFTVSPELIEKIRSGTWDPDAGDRQTRDAMAAKGYFEAHKAVKESVGRMLEGGNPGVELRTAHGNWYRAMFSPGVQAGLLKPQDLAGYRNDQVFIRGAQHVPLSKEAVRESMPVLFDLLEREPHAGVRAVLGHFVFVYIHPYMDGNGRIGRFLMNSLLSSSGYPWTVIPVQRRNDYMSALAQASSHRNIAPFAAFIGELVNAQRNAPPERSGNRAAAG